MVTKTAAQDTEEGVAQTPGSAVARAALAAATIEEGVALDMATEMVDKGQENAMAAVITKGHTTEAVTDNLMTVVITCNYLSEQGYHLSVANTSKEARLVTSQAKDAATQHILTMSESN